jgi:aminobenzoyl-glutamate utilization protein B
LGVSSHAAAAPELGRSALAGVELMDVAVNYMRQFVPDGTRIHNIITDGGKAPNVIPSVAKTAYYVRHQNVEILKNIQARLLKTAQGAAIATETKVEWTIRGGVYPILINKTLNKRAYNNLLREASKLSWTPQELAYAKAVQDSMGSKKPVTNPAKIAPLEPDPKAGGFGSTDVGDISYVVPTVGFSIATWPSGVPAHSWASDGASANSIGTKGAVLAARVVAETAIDLMKNPKVIADAKAELKAAQGTDFKYVPLFGDRKPPLDYTDKLSGK